MRFYLKLTGWTYLMPDATSWAAGYYASGYQTIFGAGNSPYVTIEFNDSVYPMAPSGYIGAWLFNGVTTTPIQYSTTFSPHDGDTWEYNLYLHGQPGDLTLVSSGSNVWEGLDSKSITISPNIPPAVWDRLDSKSITISPLQGGGWDKLITATPIRILNMDAGIIPPYFSLVMNTTYPEAKTYTGDAQRVMAGFSFSFDNFPGEDWFINKAIDGIISDQIKGNGLIPLNMKLYESGRWYIVVIEAGQGPAPAVAFIQVGWSAIILAALVLAALIVAAVIVFRVTDFIIKQPGAAIGIGLIVAGIAGIALVGYAISKGTSVKSGITANVRR